VAFTEPLSAIFPLSSTVKHDHFAGMLDGADAMSNAYSGITLANELKSRISGNEFLNDLSG